MGEDATDAGGGRDFARADRAREPAVQAEPDDGCLLVPAHHDEGVGPGREVDQALAGAGCHRRGRSILPASRREQASESEKRLGVLDARRRDRPTASGHFVARVQHGDLESRGPARRRAAALDVGDLARWLVHAGRDVERNAPSRPKSRSVTSRVGHGPCTRRSGIRSAPRSQRLSANVA